MAHIKVVKWRFDFVAYYFLNISYFLIIVGVCILLVAGYGANEVSAEASKGTLEVEPAFTEVILENPDDVKNVVFTYKNNSDNPITLEIYPIDFRQADGSGAINFLGTQPGSFSYSLSSYLSFATNMMQLDPGAKKDFSVTVRNREDISPGGHYAAIVSRVNIDTSAEDLSEGPRIAPSVSALILLRKTGGEKFNLSLTDLDFPSDSIVFSYPLNIKSTFRNEGNVHLVPFGNMQIRDIFGRLVYSGTINTGSLRVFPETKRYINIQMQKKTFSLPISINTIIVSGEDSLGKVKFIYKDTFIYVNLYFILVIMGALIFYLIWRRRRYIRKFNSLKTSVRQTK